MGRVPDWKPVIDAARYLGVAPWDLIRAHPAWRQWALDHAAVSSELDVLRRRRAAQG